MSEEDINILHEMMLKAAGKGLYDLAAKIREAKKAAKKSVNEKWAKEILSKINDEKN